MSLPKVLLLIPSMTGVGGTERMVHAISGLLQQAGYEVHQASFDAPKASRHFNSQAPLHALGPIPRLPLLFRPFAYALSSWRLRALKRGLGTGITISNLWGADFISILAGGSDRKLALCHINIIGNRSNRLMMAFLPLVAAVYRRFDRVIAVSAPLAGELRELYRLPVERIGHIDNFTECPSTTPLWPVSEGSQRFVWCGRFSHEKNVSGLLHAWARFASGCPSAQLILVGEGPDRDSMYALAIDLGLKVSDMNCLSSAQVVFAGRQADPAAFMASARALLLSSHAEGLPMVVLEALALGIPVIAADCPSGGVRSALIGEGDCDPCRPNMVHTPAGLLLPVPESLRPESLRIWVEALMVAVRDDGQHAAWSRGAVERAHLFSSGVARERWLSVLSELQVSA